MIEYRKADTKDVDNLVRLRVEFLREIGNLESSENDKVLEKALYEYLNKTIPCDEFVAWLALDSDKIVGTSGLSFYLVPPSYKNPSGKVAYIMNMYTVPQYRKQGVAKALFERTVDEAKSRGYKLISLHATEQGRPLYLKFGFKETYSEMDLRI
jgi:GNAT superfamily N-acetyltransferase